MIKYIGSRRANLGAAAVALTAGMMVPGCATMPSKTVPCYDGWMTNGAGEVSRLLDPSAFSRAEISRFLPLGTDLACMHRLPDGDIVLVYVDRDVIRTVTIAEDGTGGFTFVEHGAIV